MNFNDGEIKPLPVALQNLSASHCSARVVLSALTSSLSSLTSLSLFKITEGELFSDISLPLLTDLTIAQCSHSIADYLVNSSLKTLEKVTIKDRSALNIVIKEDFYKLKSLFIENPYSISTFLSRSRNTLEHFFVRYFLSNPVYSLPNLSLLVLSVWNSEIFERGSFTNLKTLIILRGQNSNGLQGYTGEFLNLEKLVLPEDTFEYVDDINDFVDNVKKKCDKKIDIKFVNVLKIVNNLKFPDDFMKI